MVGWEWAGAGGDEPTSRRVLEFSFTALTSIADVIMRCDAPFTPNLRHYGV